MKKICTAAVVFLAATAFAASGTMAVLVPLCLALRNILPVIGMLVIVFASSLYVGGQKTGGEFEKNASIWATAAAICALLAVLISVAVPPLFNLLNMGTAVC